WQMDVRIGGRGGSHHLEVAAPPGIDIVGIAANPVAAGRGAVVQPRRPWRRLAARAWVAARPAGGGDPVFWHPDGAGSVSGHAPHVHLNPPDSAFLRYRAAIFVRVSRPGWLTASWLIAVVIAVVITAGRLNLRAVYGRSAAGEAGTAATLLLALLGVFATMLV